MRLWVGPDIASDTSPQVLIFIVAISEYNQKLYEDRETNRLTESLTLWDSIVNSICMSASSTNPDAGNASGFRKSTIILFMNKIDLFQQKLAEHPLAYYLPDYAGPNTYEATSKYLLQTFLAESKDAQRTIHGHFTCAVQRDQVAVVLSTVVDHILTQNLANVGVF